MDERLANLDPFQRWAQVLSQNLRHFRAGGFDADKAQKLQASAESQAKASYEKHGWEQLPPPTIPGVKPLG